MAYLSNTSINGDLGVSGLTSVGSAGLKFTSGIINIFGSSNSGGTGGNSISIGSQAAATGTYGVAIGYNAKASKTNGVAIGGAADANSSAIASGDHSIAIGGSSDSYAINASGANSIAIGGWRTQASGTKGIAIGYGAMASTGTNIGYNGNAGTGLYFGVRGLTSPWLYMTSAYGQLTTSSDSRDKCDFKNISKGLEFITKLVPVTYLDNGRENYILEDGTFDEESYNKGLLKGDRRIAGFKAQDVYNALKETYNDDNYAKVVDYNKYNKDTASDDELDKYFLTYDALIPFLVDAIKEQQKEIAILKEKISNLENKLLGE